MKQTIYEVVEPNCFDCGVKIGQTHKHGCDVEACNVCYERYHCVCSCHGKGRKLSPWTGEIPGVEDCRLSGWFTVRAARGWKPCVVGTPGATEDISRWSLYKASGRDSYLEGRMACPGCSHVVCDCLRPVPTFHSTIEHSHENNPDVTVRGASWPEFSDIMEKALRNRLLGDLFFTITYPSDVSVSFKLKVENPYIGDGNRPTDEDENISD